jgi:ATP-dependent DNA helicase HFM1/MER3
MDKPPKKKTTTKRVSSGKDRPQPQQKEPTQKGKETQTRLQLTTSKRKSLAPIEELDLTQQEKKRRADYDTDRPKDYRNLHQLHKTIQGNDLPSSLHSVMRKNPAYCYSQGGEYNLTFLDQPADRWPPTSSDYGDVPFDEPPSHFHRYQQADTQQDTIQLSGGPESEDYADCQTTAPTASRGPDTFGDDDSLLGDAMIGLADSHDLREVNEDNYDVMQPLEETLDYEDGIGYGDDHFQMDADLGSYGNGIYDAPEEVHTPVEGAHSCKAPTKESRYLFCGGMSSPQPEKSGFRSAKTMLKGTELGELAQLKAASPISRPTRNEQPTPMEVEVPDILDRFEDELVNDVPAKKKPIPDAFKDLEPWLFQEFGDIVELVDE